MTLRRVAVVLVAAAAFAIGTALGMAIADGPGDEGMVTQQRTLEIVTAPNAQP